MLLKLFSIFVIFILANSQCQPLYWEVDPTYTVTSNELSYVANMGLSPNDITEAKGTVLNKTTYNVSKITGVITYDRTH